jgi:phosphoribosylformylglycinamidine cyclo-ligase
LPEGLGIDINTSGWHRPEVFAWLQENGAITETEMLRTFNCGIGMTMIVPETETGTLSKQAESLGIECFDIGTVTTAGADSPVRYHS